MLRTIQKGLGRGLILWCYWSNGRGTWDSAHGIRFSGCTRS